jgi:hypothetical protein
LSRGRSGDDILIYLPGWCGWHYFRQCWCLLRRGPADHVLIYRLRRRCRRAGRQKIDISGFVNVKLTARPRGARCPALCRRIRFGRVNRAGNRRAGSWRLAFPTCDNLHSGSVALRVAVSCDFCRSNVTRTPRSREHLPLGLRLWPLSRGGAFVSRFLDVRARGNVFVLRPRRGDDGNRNLRGWRRLSLTGQLWRGH